MEKIIPKTQKSKKTRIIGLLALIALLIIGIFISQNMKVDPKDSSAIYFLPTQGLIHTTPGEEETIQLFCYGRKENPLLAEGIKMTPIRTDNENLAITESTIESGSTYKGMTIFSVCLTVEAGSPSNQTFTKIFLMDEGGNTKAFDIGEVEIEVQEPNEGTAINIRQQFGSGSRGAPYSFSFKNGASKVCTISSIDFGSLTPFIEDVNVTVNDKEVDAYKDIVIQPSDVVYVEAKLKNTSEVDIYLISANLRYRILGDPKEYYYTLPYGTIGLPDTTESFQALAEKYLKN